jgi:beta-phosphoglucomutase-like phosphatase (HAD superfamily)
MPRAAIFDIDGTLVDSVDLHARAWHEALVKFGHQVTFKQARSQIGKGGDQLIPMFLSEAEQKGSVATFGFGGGSAARGISPPLRRRLRTMR